MQPHVYKSKGGTLILGNSIELLGKNEEISALKGKVNLIVTSPPFPLNNKKKSMGMKQARNIKNGLLV